MGCGFQTAFLFLILKGEEQNDRHTFNGCFIQGTNF